MWLEHVGEPLSRTQLEAEDYLTAELERSVPGGWRVVKHPVRRHSPECVPSLTWEIVPAEPPGEWPDQFYGVHLAASLEYIIITHSNRDVGIVGLHHSLHHAMTIGATELRHYGMPACLGFVMSHFKPNERGAT